MVRGGRKPREAVSDPDFISLLSSDEDEEKVLPRKKKRVESAGYRCLQFTSSQLSASSQGKNGGFPEQLPSLPKSKSTNSGIRPLTFSVQAPPGQGSQSLDLLTPESALLATEETSHGHTQHAGSHSWISKHRPRREEQLALHPKKVRDVKEWICGQLEGKTAQSRMLIATGPPGCGKSTTIQVLAAAAELDVIEWQTPVPTLWAECRYQGSAGTSYASKIDEFEMFVARTKFAALPLSISTTGADNSRQVLPGPE